MPIRMEARQQAGAAPYIQKVKIRGPTFKSRVKSALIFSIALYVSTSIYGKVVLEPLANFASTLPPPPEEDEEHDHDHNLFVPFPGTVKQLKPRPYRGSDPEWQEFVKFSKDRSLQNKVRDELAHFVRKVAEKHPVIMAKCGTNLKLRRCWLDVDFPYHGPPEFERSGIEVSDEAISWVTQPVDSLIVFKLRHVLWPSALVQSFWNFGKVLIVEESKSIAEKFGYKPPPPPLTIDQLMAHPPQMIKGPLPSKDGPPVPPAGSGADAKSAISTATKSEITPEEELESELNQQRMAVHKHFNRAITAFKTKLKQTWRPAPDFPPRGSILLSGMVELESTKAYLVFDVKAAWDPKAKAYDPRSLKLQLRRFQYKSQGPVA
ncbi:hypothetical protein BGZ60DRAFT_535213 [Tricladium varicosporioides]|nr:hypothetical protein BGZ60DRAFT_535213 [Hymenoscyphus varicosporioides]